MGQEKKRIISPQEFDALGDKKGEKRIISPQEFDALGSNDAGPSSSALQSAAQGAGSGALMGYAPHLAAGIGQAMGGIDELQQKITGKYIEESKNVDKKLVAGGFKIDQPDDNYVNTRDQFLKQQESVKKDHPYAYGFGELAGTIGGGAKIGGLIGKIPGLGIQNGSGLLSRVAKSAAQGGIAAGLVNPGDKEGEVQPLQAGPRLRAAKMGAAIGGATPIVSKALAGIGNFGKKLLSEGSGIPRQDIETYAKRTAEVNDLIKRSGGNLVEMSDDVRNQIDQGIQSYKKGLNDRISKELGSFPADKILPVEPLINELAKVQGQMNPRLQKGEYDAINELSDKLMAESVDGKVDPKTMHEIKTWLQEEADTAYRKVGQVFTNSSNYERAAKDAAKQAREMVSVASDMIGNSEVRTANSALSELHQLQDSINKNLITPGKPEAALMAAGSGGNLRNLEMLKKLGSLTGQDMAGNAQLLSAARQFASPGWIPIDSTGKSATRMAAGLLTGAGLGMSQGHTTEGAALGAAATSPMAVKTGINLASSISGSTPDLVKSLPGQIKQAATPAITGMGVGQAMSSGFQRDPFIALSESPDNLKYAIENKQIPEEALKAFVGWSGPLTREQYIRASSRLKSVQGRAAFKAAIHHVQAVENPEMNLGPAAEMLNQGGGQDGR